MFFFFLLDLNETSTDFIYFILILAVFVSDNKPRHCHAESSGARFINHCQRFSNLLMQLKRFEMILHALGGELLLSKVCLDKKGNKKKIGDDLPGSEHEVTQLTDF